MEDRRRLGWRRVLEGTWSDHGWYWLTASSRLRNPWDALNRSWFLHEGRVQLSRYCMERLVSGVHNYNQEVLSHTSTSDLTIISRKSCGRCRCCRCPPYVIGMIREKVRYRSREQRCATTVLLSDNDLVEKLDRRVIRWFRFALVNELIEHYASLLVCQILVEVACKIHSR
jgi:hypothetical protein